MARDFHPDRSDKRGLQKNQRALETLLDLLFGPTGAIILDHGDLAGLADGDPHTQYVLLAGRAGGQTILQKLTVEGGLAVNALGAAVDAIFGGDTEPNLLFLQGSTERVGIGTASPANRFHVAQGSASEAVMCQFENTGGGGTQFRLVTTGRTWALRQVSTGLIFRDVTGAVEPLILEAGSPSSSLRTAAGGVSLFGAGSFGGGVGVKFQANATTVPTSNPAGGGVDYKSAGADIYRGSGGSITTRAPA